MNRTKRQQEMVAYTNNLINAVMEWYCTGEAIDCEETRRNINKDLDSVLPRVEAKFHLRPIPKVLRARSQGNGQFVVRMEDKFLN